MTNNDPKTKSPLPKLIGLTLGTLETISPKPCSLFTVFNKFVPALSLILICLKL